MGKYKSFRDMDVWKLAFKLSLEVNKISTDLPRYEDYALNAQIRKASTSVAANIAEGFGRKSSRDKCHFYVMARGSANETQNHLLYGEAVNYYNESKSMDLIKKYDELVYQLNKIIKSIS